MCHKLHGPNMSCMDWQYVVLQSDTLQMLEDVSPSLIWARKYLMSHTHVGYNISYKCNSMCNAFASYHNCIILSAVTYNKQ